MPLIWFCVAWLIGIVVGDWLALPAQITGLIGGCLLLLSGVWWARRDVRLPLLLAAACLLGTARLAYAQPVTTAASVWAYTGQKVTLVGLVAEQPDRREDKQTAVLAAEQAAIGERTLKVHGRVLLKLPPNPELRYGQRITLQGRLEQPRAGDDFDYRAYLARHGIYATMAQPQLSMHAAQADGGSWWQRATTGLNDHARRTGAKAGDPTFCSTIRAVCVPQS